MHAYRDPDAPGQRPLTLTFAGAMLFPVAWAAAGVLLGNGLTWSFVRFAAPAIALWWLFAYLAYRHLSYGFCHEIRLSDDGTCELETRRRVVRLHVNEIKSVRYQRDSDDDSESYTIRYSGGKLTARDRMANFPDFLARLTSMNPAVDLAGFPAGGPRRAPAKDPREGLTVRSLAFPIVVAAIIAWLAVETLTGG